MARERSDNGSPATLDTLNGLYMVICIQFPSPLLCKAVTALVCSLFLLPEQQDRSRQHCPSSDIDWNEDETLGKDMSKNCCKTAVACSVPCQALGPAFQTTSDKSQSVSSVACKPNPYPLTKSLVSKA